MRKEHTGACCSNDLIPKEMPMPMMLYQVVHLHKQYVLQQMKPTGLQVSQAGILFILRNCGPMSQREIADKIHVTPPSVTVAIQKLEKLGYIERRPDERDQRVMRIYLTEPGDTAVDQVQRILETTQEKLLRHMSPEEKLLLRRLVLQMRDNLMEEQELDLKFFHHPDCI